jgi:DNA-directed RNA polymerase subunit H (RpoH/RPB5)
MDTVFQNLMKMLDKRNYNVSQYISKTNINENDFDINFCLEDGTIVKIIYANELKIGINHIKSYFNVLDDRNCKNAIIIMKGHLTSFAKQYIDTNNYNIELYNESMFYKDIYSHYLVPDHRLLNQEEKHLLLDSLKIQPNNLPKIKKTDPISRYFGAKYNDIFEISRNENGIQSKYYRLCI